ncbi:MAG TPA: hypothetical protein VHC69_33745 [Polyangiaceae bacterium]|nr:hypothetical protein [Polyangiaceae bacterium]
MTGKEFAAEIGVTPKALAWWKWHLAKEQPAKATWGRPRKRKTALSPMTFIEMAPAAKMEAVEIVWPSGVRMLVPSGVDTSALGRIIDVLEKRR